MRLSTTPAVLTVVVLLGLSAAACAAAKLPAEPRRATSAAKTAPADLLEFSIRQWRKTPEMTVQDACKWLFQATLGGEHAISDDAGPRQWLAGEWQEAGAPMPGEPEAVPLRPDGSLLRVNIRPYRAAGGDQASLLHAFVQSARQFHADRSAFVAPWKLLGERLRKGSIGRITLKDWQALDARLRAEGYPAVHHSDDYQKAYHPSYRVVLKEVWQRERRVGKPAARP